MAVMMHASKTPSHGAPANNPSEIQNVMKPMNV